MTDVATAAPDEDVESTEASADGQPSGRTFDRKKLILIAAAVFVVLLGAGAGIYFSGLLGGGKDAADAGKAEEAEAAAANAAPVAAHYLDLD